MPNRQQGRAREYMIQEPGQRAKTVCAYSSAASDQAGTEVCQPHKVNILLWLVLANLITGSAAQESMQRDTDTALLPTALQAKQFVSCSKMLMSLVVERLRIPCFFIS